jgi:hypothetical protein
VAKLTKTLIMFRKMVVLTAKKKNRRQRLGVSHLFTAGGKPSIVRYFGVRRATVTLIAGRLEAAAVIDGRRGDTSRGGA